VVLLGLSGLKKTGVFLGQFYYINPDST